MKETRQTPQPAQRPRRPNPTGLLSNDRKVQYLAQIHRCPLLSPSLCHEPTVEKIGHMLTPPIKQEMTSQRELPFQIMPIVMSGSLPYNARTPSD